MKAYRVKDVHNSENVGILAYKVVMFRPQEEYYGLAGELICYCKDQAHAANVCSAMNFYEQWCLNPEGIFDEYIKNKKGNQDEEAGSEG